MPGTLLVITLASVFLTAKAGDVMVPDVGGGLLNVKVVSMKERRFATTIRQQHDYSCGSAALATLLTHHYRHPVSEETVFKSMWEKGDQTKISREGFSLLDIKRYLEGTGYSADGYEAPLERLASVGIPAIVLIRDNGYNHFVVVRGIQDGKVAVADPSVGARVIPQKQFEKMRLNRILFVINGRKEQVAFNRAADWKIREKAPIGVALGADSLASSILLRRSPSDY
ncbi:MAG: C39 family peptidase [Thiobacillus sp.]